MKKSKKLGIVAAVLTALACALPNVARGAGDIWSIEPYQDMETVDRDFSTTKEQPLSVGDVFKIRVRLLNRNWAMTVGDASYSRPWTFKYVGTPGGETLAQMKMPKLGVWVSGKLKFAELDGTPTPAASETSPDRYFFTDLIFKYTVQAGDLALPIKLANPMGNGPIEANAMISGEYYLMWGRGPAYLEDWQLVNADGETCSLTFTDQQANPPLTPPMPNMTWDFSNPSIYIQAIDFDSNYADAENGVWREISSGLTSATPLDPAIAIPGGAAETVDLYVWTKDSSVAEVVRDGDVLGVTDQTDIFGNHYKVGRIRIPATQTGVSFKIRAAEAAGQTTDVYLSSTPTNVYNVAQELLTNFVTRTIKVITPPPPFVSVSFTEGAPRTVAADGDFAKYKTVLQVGLSQSYTNDVTVTLQPSLVNNAGIDPWKYMGISLYDDEGVYLQRQTSVTIPAGTRTSSLLYVYALAADQYTRDLTNGIVFKATISDPAAQAFFTGMPVDATLHIDTAKPVVSMPDAPYTETSSIQSGETTLFSVAVSDSYANITGAYDVFLNENTSFKGTEEPVATGLVPNASGFLTVPYRYIGTDRMNSRIKVRNAAGLESAVVTFEVNSLAARKLKGVPADGNEDRVYAEGRDATIRAVFSPAFTLASEAYVFLEPADDLAAQNATSLNFTRGVRIQNGGTEAAVAMKLNLLDGTVDSASRGLRYRLRLRTAEVLEEGNDLEGYTSEDYTLYVTNVVPAVSTVRIGGMWEPAPAADGRLVMESGAKVAVGVGKIFTYEPVASEVNADLTNGTFTAKWNFYDGNGYTTNVVGSPYAVTVPYTFQTSGRKRITVELQDKDVRAEGELKFGPKYEFWVDVEDHPAVSILPANGANVLSEESTGLSRELNVSLTMPPEGTVKVKLTVARDGDGTDETYPLPTLSKDTLEFSASMATNKVTLENIDGTRLGARNGYIVTATVVSEAAGDEGSRYLPGSFKLYIENSPPLAILPDPAVSNSLTTVIGEENQIDWEWDDLSEADCAKGVEVTITTSENTKNTFMTTEKSGKYAVTFKSSGDKWVKFTFKDKDGGVSQTGIQYFTIGSAKLLKIYPKGPHNPSSGLSKLASTLLNKASGVGVGRVWTEEDKPTQVNEFAQTWSYPEGISSVAIYAQGYRPGDIDNGGLNNGMKPLWGVTKNGALFDPGAPTPPAADTAYVAGGDRDSFLYAWILNSADEASSYVGTSQLAVKKGFGSSMLAVKLPEDEEDAVSYVDTHVEAIFSREFKPQDNMGDINGDGIPDFWAIMQWDGGYMYQLMAAADGGGGSGGEEVDVSDLKSVWGFNGDEDYLPAAARFNDPIDPPEPGWGKHPDTEFLAGLEIRGRHMGLNEPGISEADFSEAEEMALFMARVAELKKNGASADELAAAATDREAMLEWAVKNGKNFERRTDPTIADTDGDKLPDGFEYFFWYYAKVGVIDSFGKWKRLTGSRYNDLNPGQGILITPESIAAHFDPKTPLTGMSPEATDAETGDAAYLKDFDNDGLTDLEEFYLGTNPVHWDSDGDGVSDFYEILTGTDPLDWEDGIGGVYACGKENYTNKAKGNPDGDYMAYMTSTNTFTVVKVEAEDGTTHVYGTVDNEGAVTVDAGDETANVWHIRVFEEVSPESQQHLDMATWIRVWDWVDYFVEEQPVLMKDSTGAEYLAFDMDAWKAIKVGSGDDAVYYIGEPTTLLKGAAAECLSEEPADESFAVTVGFKSGIELFRYGSDLNGVWVPMPINGKDRYEERDPMTGKLKEIAFKALAYEPSMKIVYLHHQVYQMCGYDPRTAWSQLANGYVSDRWNQPVEGETGYAQNTKPFTTRDEYLAMQYRYFCRDVFQTSGDEAPVLVGFWANRSAEVDSTLKLDARYMVASTRSTPAGAIELPETEEGDIEAVDGDLLRLKRWTEEIDGADSDNDGIPDGWELYVNLNPSNGDDADKAELWLEIGKHPRWNVIDADQLTPVDEFAGVDSCNAYSNVPSIYANHPGVTKGWWNKFFPTDPANADTDGDGISDKEEGADRFGSGDYWFGRSSYGRIHQTFIYGDTASNVTDMKTRCFRGGGLNPCSVDTDGDLLPDPWEKQFAGVVFTPAGVPEWPDEVKLWQSDIDSMRLSDGMSGAAQAKNHYIAGGMDGTWAGDAGSVMAEDPVTGTHRDTDWDHDGLMNYQEYLVQTLRHLRYDDSETPLMGRYLQWDTEGVKQEMPFIGFIPMQTWDGEAFRKTCLAAGYAGTSDFDFRMLGYFARPPKAWDRMALENSSLAASLNNYADVGYRYMLPPMTLLPDSKPPEQWTRRIAQGYACTDPRRWDSDNDGMDDYYELFHGLNPLLGSAADPRGGGLTSSVDGWNLGNQGYDVIAQIYDGRVTSWYNAWTWWDKELFAKRETTKFDPIKYPWMIGTAECDADGDGINNADESITVNDAAPAASHTDPTPLWMTDTTSKDHTSYVSQYYQFDPTWGDKADLAKLWENGYSTGGITWFQEGVITSEDGFSEFLDGRTAAYKFAFEENEGFDTDGDFIGDAAEKTKTIQEPSDALNFSDPNRRQAMFFPGSNSAVVSYRGTQLRPNSWEGDMLKQFTVEAWICPWDVSREQVVLERVAYYDASTLSNNTASVRRNFRIGIDATGHVYGEFEGKTVDSGAVRVVCDSQLAQGAWTHVAVSFDGSALSLFIDDNPTPVAVARGVSLIPANGVNIRIQEAGGNRDQVKLYSHLEYGYTTVPCAFVVGAAALNESAMKLSKNTTWADYGSFYSGFVDEIRVWDGARPGESISADVFKRYSFQDVKAQRDTIYGQWAQNARRGNGTVGPKLDPELLQLYNFTTMPGAVDAYDVVTEPSGFTSGVLDNVRIDGRLHDVSVGWWSDLPVHSVVYCNYSIVPRIQNSVGHLPVYDGSAWDSEYWSQMLGGVYYAGQTFAGMENPQYDFPNSANPYSCWNFNQERVNHRRRLDYLAKASNSVDQVSELITKYEFDVRSGFVGTGDLVPLGNAYARRTDVMWDGQGAADAWDQTGLDSDGDGLPDWWEYGVAGQYGAAGDITWSTFLTYKNGQKMTASEAYIRDLAGGMLPDGQTHDNFKVTRVDSNGDGLPDWWQKIYALGGESALGDVDNDQLSNYAEYLISEVFTQYGFPRVDPAMGRTDIENGQQVPDYFLRFGRMYLGEMFGDHDMIEDWWEDLYDVSFTSRFTFDGASDKDGDGWSVFAEARAGTNPGRVAYMGVDGTTIQDFPIPLVQITATYNGTQPVAGKNVIVKAYRMDYTTGVPDAVWNISGASESAAASKNEVLIGMNPQKSVDLSLGPGSVIVGSVVVYVKDPTRTRAYGYVEAGKPVVTSTVKGDPLTATWASEAGDRAIPGDPVHGLIVSDSSDELGVVDYQTGAITLNLNKFVGSRFYNQADNNGLVSWDLYSLSNSYVKVEWQSKQANQGFPQTFYLSRPADPTLYTSRGRLREGRNMFVAFVDVNNDGAWTAGEPIGSVADIDVGWNRTAPFNIEMTDTSPMIARIDLASSEGSEEFDAVNAFVDRGIRGSYYPNVAPAFAGTNIPVHASTRVRVVRSQVNGVATLNGQSYNEVVYDGIFDLTAHPVLSEADLRAKGVFDLDWSQLRSAWMRTHSGSANMTSLTNAAYRVVLGDGTVAANEFNNNLPLVFVNAFQNGAAQTKAVPVAPAGTVYAGQPSFSWRHDALDAQGMKVKDYPAFRLRVWKDAAKSVLVYDSGVQVAPARDAAGVYSWTAPIYADMATPQGQMFATQENYFWSVSMLDAKFMDPNADETVQEFRMETSGLLGTLSDYGTIEAKVKYFGPAGTSAGSLNGMVRVQAFSTPDFTGMPVGEGFVNGVETLSTPNQLVVNAKVLGVPPGTYYLRAFIDTDGDAVRSEWESWGYACYVGTDRHDVYTPQPFTLSKGMTTRVAATIYIEDMDTDNDGLPDAWEIETSGSLGTKSSPTGATFFSKVNPDLAGSVQAYTEIGSLRAVSQQFAAVTYLAALAANDAQAIAAASQMLGGVPAAGGETVNVAITSFSRKDGIALEIGTEVAAVEGSLVVVADSAKVGVQLVASETPDFADAKSVKVKDITIKANAVTRELVTAEEVEAAIKANGLDKAAFLKVKLVRE